MRLISTYIIIIIIIIIEIYNLQKYQSKTTAAKSPFQELETDSKNGDKTANSLCTNNQ